MTVREFLRRSDPLLAGSAVLLSVLSLVLLGTGGDNSHSFFVRQLSFVLIGLLAMALTARTHYTSARSTAPALYGLLLLLLLMVTRFETVRGATSWISLGTLNLQPSELAKGIFVIVLAKVFSERPRRTLDAKTLLVTMAYAGVPITLTLLQPDLGTAALLLFIWFGMATASGLRRRHAAALALLAILIGVLGWSFGLQEYQKERFRVFVQPQADPLGSGYTVLQSVTASGSGGTWGRGIGYGSQSRLNFLPEHRTDFIFARIGEELGLAGVLGVLTLYGVMALRMLRAAARTSDPFGRGVAAGACVTLVVGVFVNAGMNIGLLPVTGVPLPFVSYGGSSLITMFLLVGLVESVVIHGETWEELPEDVLAGFTTHHLQRKDRSRATPEAARGS